MGTKFVLVTGATSGIGKETALLAAQAGYHVIAAGRSQAKLQELKRLATEQQLPISCASLDVTSAESIRDLQDFVEQVTRGYGLDTVVNNAGYSEAGAVEEMPISQMQAQFETNVFGLMRVTQAFLPQMRARRSGRIINITSGLGQVSVPMQGVYCASKFAVEALSDALRIELSGSGIAVVVVAPGATKTEFDAIQLSQLSSWSSTDSPYANAYAKLRLESLKNSGAQPALVARCVVKALQAARPKPRYAVTADAKYLPKVIGLLPRRWSDKLLYKLIMAPQ